MHTRTGLILLALLHLWVTPGSLAVETPTPNEQRVRDYVSAFNAREIDTMLGMVSDDIQWLSVVGDKIIVETQGNRRPGWRRWSAPFGRANLARSPKRASAFMSSATC